MKTSESRLDCITAPLQEGISLEVCSEGRTVFQSTGKWLYPLFELEEVIDRHFLRIDTLELHDKVAGRAAAALICRMGITRCHIDLISKPALALFKDYEVACTYNTLVDKIQCSTEDLITTSMELYEVYRFLKKRAKLIQGINIDITNLEAGYPGNTVLKHFNLSLDAGEQFVLTGDNGTGKTTLLKTIIGVLPLRKGRIRLTSQEGLEVAKSSPVIGYITQSTTHNQFPIATEEVVAIGMKGEAVHGEALKYQVEVAMRQTGSFHLYGRNFYSLSGGERQRVSLARCLCQKAGLILMDEPTSFLDSAAKNELIDILGRIGNNQMPTILVVSHDHELIERLEWPVGRLAEGRLCLIF